MNIRISEESINSKVKTIYLYIIIIFSIPTIILLYKSIEWHPILDSPIFQYIAYKILNGVTPYKEIFDMNLPGTYWIHIITIKIFGLNSIGFRITDLIFLFIILLSGGLILKEYGSVAVFTFIAVFSGIHLAGGEANMGERDYFMTGFVGLSLYFIIQYIKKSKNINLFIAGIFIGYAGFIKPTSYILYFLIVLILLIKKKGNNKIIMDSILLTIGVCIFPGIFTYWLYKNGGINDFVNICVNYLPIYQNGSISSTFKLIYSIWKSPLDILIAGSLIILPIVYDNLFKQDKKRETTYLLLFVGVLFFLFNFVIKGQAENKYRLYPGYYFFAIYAGIIISTTLKEENLKTKLSGTIYLMISMSIICMYTILTIYKKNSEINYNSYITKEKETEKEIIKILRKNGIRKDEKIQIFDVVGGANILLKLGVNPATKYLQEVHFTEMQWKGNFPLYLQKQWDNFIFTLYSEKPEYIVMLKSSYFYREKVSNIGVEYEVRNLLNRFYHIINENNQFIIYKLK